jgi:hypothetical protein
MGQVAGSQTDEDNKNASDLALKCDGRWNNETFSLEAEFQQIGDDFAAESGFLPDVFIGRRRYGVEGDFGKHFKSRKLRRIGFGTEYRYASTLDGIRTRESWGAGGMIMLGDIFFRGGFEREFRTDPDNINISYNDSGIGGFVGFFPPKYLGAMMDFTIGTRDEKDILHLGPELNIRPITPVSISFDAQFVRREDEDDEMVLRSVLDYAFSQTMNFRLSGEGNRKGNRSVFSLYSWEFRPESNFFIVYSYNKYHDEEEEDETIGEEEFITEQILYVKISYRLRWTPPWS